MGGHRRRRAEWAIIGIATTWALGLLACEFIYDVPLLPGDAGTATTDATSDRVAPDVSDVHSVPMDAGSGTRDASPGASDGSVYNSIDGTAANWTSFNTLGVNPAAKGFAGGTFDGRYVYLCPNSGSVAVRYDTQSSAFTTSGAWGAFDTAPLYDAGPTDDLDSGSFEFDSGVFGGAYGCVFDGQYVYLIPGAISPPSFAVRFNTKDSFGSASSWESFETSKLEGGGAYGFAGGTFDGTYVYMVPNESSTLARFDTRSAFSGAGWSTFDLDTLGDGGVFGFGAFVGAVFDGRYVYLVPNLYTTIAARYDTMGPLDSASSWTTFDTSTVNGDVYGSAGGAFDGQYVYLVPAGSGLVLRYEVSQSFTSASSWAFFDTTMLGMEPGGYFGGAFDGRYVYFVPDENEEMFEPSSLLARYDTTANFFDPSSWKTFDTQPLDNAMGFVGAVFDGDYLYLVPNNNGAVDGIVARFDARKPPLLPALPDFHGSFF